MKKILLSFLLALLITNSYAQNVGIGTSTPAEKLHVAGSLRADDLQTAVPTAAASDKVVWVDANGKVYSFPTGAIGKVLGVNGAGVLAWLNPGLSNSLNNGQIWIGDPANAPVPQTASGDALISNTGVITIQDNAVDGTDISISAESNGSLMYFDGTDWVNLGVGTAGQILTISGGVPAWVSPAAASVTGNLTTATSGLTVTGGTGAVLGAGTTVNVATNALNQNGLVTGPTAGNALQVWGTDALGNPGWVDPSSLVEVDNGLYYNGVAGKIRQGGALVENTTITQGAFDYLHALSGAGVFEARNGATAGNGLYVNPSNNVGIGTAAPLGKFQVESAGIPNIVSRSSSTIGTWMSLNNSSVGGQWFNIISTGSANGEGPGKLLFSRGLGQTLVTGHFMVFDHANANIGMGTNNPDPSSYLDITSTTRGLLAPRLALTATNSATPTTLPATSLLVYNTATTGVGATAVIPGYYYNAGIPAAPNWVRIDAGGNDWHITGNVGTSPATNFLGTTDNVDLVTRTNNTEKMRVNTAGQVGIGTAFSPIGSTYGFEKLKIAGDANVNDVELEAIGGGGFGAFIVFNKANGTYAAAPTRTVVANGDQLGHLQFSGYDGTAYRPAANFIVNIDGTPGANDMPTRMGFYTTPDGTAAAVERMRITNAGNIAINTAAPSITDRVNIVSGATMNGILLTSQQTTAGSYGLRNNATFAGATSATTYTGYNGTIAIAGATVTNAGIFVDVTNGTAPSIVGSTNGTNTSASIIGTSTVWQGGNMRTSLPSAAALVGVNTAASGTSIGYGTYGQTSQRNGVGIYGLNNGPLGLSFGYGSGDSRVSVYGDGLTAGSYAFGVLGDGGTSARSGGVFGDDYGFARGALGYYSSGLVDYSVYGFGLGYTTGAAGGRMSGSNDNVSHESEPNNMVGLGIYGGVMGGWVRGLHYGFHTKGVEYGMYVDGNTVTNKPVVQLIENGTEKRSVSFAPAAMSADVYVRGNTNLRNGTAYISFNENFSNIISAEIPLNITITPTGASKGVYVTEVTSKGFRIVENENGTSSVSVNWVAYGTRTGYENPENVLSNEIMSSRFDQNMDAVMFNENNTEGQAKGLWYDGEKVLTGETPASFQAAKAAKVRTREVPSSAISNPNPPRNANKVQENAPTQIGTSDMPADMQKVTKTERGIIPSLENSAKDGKKAH